VRFRGLLQRRELAGKSKKPGFVWVQVVRERSGGLVPNFQLPMKKNSQFPRIVLFALPFTTQFRKAIEVKSHYADLRYFVGMTPEQLGRIVHLLISEHISQRAKRKLSSLIVDLTPNENKKPGLSRLSKSA
jgi:hypothetical protein